MFFRFYLSESTKQFANDFARQNLKELAVQDSFALTVRLNNISGSINWVCIEAVNAQTPFYVQKRGSCDSGFFKSKVRVIGNNPDQYYVDFTLRLPQSLEILISLLAFFQLILLFIFIALSRSLIKSELHSANLLKNLAHQLAHDLRSPLAVLDQALVEKDFILIKKSSDKIHTIASDLLIERKQEQNHFDLRAILESLVSSKEKEYKKQKPQIHLHEIPEYKLPIPSSELERLISNLLNNAIESSTSPQINISAKTTNEKTFLIISDNGKGISPENLAQLGKKSLTTKKDGNGLGLLNAFELMKKWEGDIQIESELGKGTTITLIFPFSTKVPTILIDDDPLVRLTWESRAKKMNIPFQSFSNPQELKNLISTFPNTTTFYIDHEIKGSQISGLELAKELSTKGFSELYLATGYDAKNLPPSPFIKGIVGKKPPF